MSALTVAALEAEINKLRRHYLFVCNPADAKGVQHVLDQLDLGGLTTIEVRPNGIIDPGTGYLMRYKTEVGL